MHEFCVILLTNQPTSQQMSTSKNITSLAEAWSGLFELKNRAQNSVSCIQEMHYAGGMQPTCGALGNWIHYQ